MIIKTDPRIISVHVSDKIRITLADDREIAIPLAWSPRLQRASQEKRNHTEIALSGTAIHWPDVDEDIEVSVFLSRGDVVVFSDRNILIQDDGSLEQQANPG